MNTTAYSVQGMTCAHCVKAVNDELMTLTGVTDVSIELAPSAVSTVHVVSDRELTSNEVAAAIDEAGYELVSPTS